ncbi:MAG: hypothetical protein ABIA76_04365 [Candidatus Diapherotrites archaeon]
MLEMKSVGVFFLGIAAGMLLPSLPIPTDLAWIVPYLGFIFLILGVIVLLKR